jgi:hypothetical protein
LLSLHVTSTPAIGVPLTSVTLAVNCCVWPTAICALTGEIVTFETGGMTFSVEGALLIVFVPVELVELETVTEAVIFAIPGESAVASPLLFTIAIVGASLVQL